MYYERYDVIVYVIVFFAVRWLIHKLRIYDIILHLHIHFNNIVGAKYAGQDSLKKDSLKNIRS